MSDSLIKTRDIAFSRLHPDAEQVRAACNFLREFEGINLVSQKDALSLMVEYQLSQIALYEIEDLLHQAGFHLDNSLIIKLRRSLINYVEETTRANIGCSNGNSSCTTKIFASNYRRHSHGCRDHRPDHWRKYL